MMRLASALLIAAAAAPLGAQAVPASLKVAPPAAHAVFERVMVLMNWARKCHDRVSDILIVPGVAEAAAAEFRKIADADNDGQVTTQEYRAAREFLLARY
jgi:hypothetical protein